MSEPIARVAPCTFSSTHQRGPMVRMIRSAARTSTSPASTSRVRLAVESRVHGGEAHTRSKRASSCGHHVARSVRMSAAVPSPLSMRTTSHPRTDAARDAEPEPAKRSSILMARAQLAARRRRCQIRDASRLEHALRVVDERRLLELLSGGTLEHDDDRLALGAALLEAKAKAVVGEPVADVVGIARPEVRSAGGKDARQGRHPKARLGPGGDVAAVEDLDVGEGLVVVAHRIASPCPASW